MDHKQGIPKYIYVVNRRVDLLLFIVGVVVLTILSIWQLKVYYKMENKAPIVSSTLDPKVPMK